MIENFLEFENKKNMKIVDKLFKMIVLDFCNVTPFGKKKFFIQDFFVEENKGIYWFNNGKLFKYDKMYDKDREVNITLPKDWKKIVSKDLNYSVLNYD